MSADVQKQLEVLAAELADQAGLELIEVQVRRIRHSYAIEVTIDRPQGGINLDECSSINRKLNDAIEQKNMIPEDYTLEVNSPGLDRPLKTRRDFERAVGKPVYFYLQSAVDGKSQHEGTITSVSNDEVEIVTRKKAEVRIPLNQIIKGVQVI